MTRSKRGKLPLVIEPGKKRPSSVMIAAKFASECNIAVRGGVPIFPKWKDYKEKSSRPMIKAYINSVCVSVQTCLYTVYFQILHCLFNIKY
jgi:hypothetical protein